MNKEDDLVEFIKNEEWEIETPSGWQPFKGLCKYKPKQLYAVTTENFKTIIVTAKHCFIDEHQDKIFCKDALNKKIQTKDGLERVISIVGSPHIDEIKRIKATVDLLNSQVAEERKKGEELLSQRDEIINKLQKEKSELKDKYDDQLWQMTDKAKEVAKEADQNKAVLDSMSGMFGLNAVFWGLKKFFISALTTIVIFVVIFVVLRLLATVHPAAGAAFSIFNMIGSILLSLVKALTPKAFELANFASKDTVNEFKSPLVKIVDVIQELKEKQKESPDRVYPLAEILKRFDKEMDSDEKNLIDGILREQKWIK